MKKNNFLFAVLLIITLYIIGTRNTLIISESNNYSKKFNYFEDYNKGLMCAKNNNVNILLIFYSYNMSHFKFIEYLESEEVRNLIKNNVVIFLFVDDKAFYHNTTKGEFNKLLQNKFSSPYVPSVLIIDNKENIKVPSRGYITYEEFILFLKKVF